MFPIRSARPLLALAAAIAAGCAAAERPFVQQAAPVETLPIVTPEPLARAWEQTANWPKRWGWTSGPDDPLARPNPSLLGVIQPVTGRLIPMRQEADIIRQVEQEMQADIATLIAARHMRLWSSVTVVGEGKGAFVFVSSPEPERTGDRPSAWPSFSFKFISGERGPLGNPDVIQIQRTWFSYYDAAPDAPVRGLAVVLPGIFGTPFNVVDQAAQNLRAHGWCVLRMLAHPSRFTEQATFNLASADDINASGETIASVYDDRVAECAYAVEAAVAHVEKNRPALKGARRLAFGMSGGAIVLPTVVAYNPSVYCGAVLVAGGSNFLAVSAESNYAARIDALHLRWQGSPVVPPEVYSSLVDAYASHAALDGLYTTEALRGRPMLMIHANSDDAVPSIRGDDLWRRLGRPQRWIFDGGHETVFLALPWQFDDVMGWIDASVLGGLALK